jgi:hypothetical protein
MTIAIAPFFMGISPCTAHPQTSGTTVIHFIEPFELKTRAHNAGAERRYFSISAIFYI